jgi:predicted RNase H-like nuclease
VRDHRSPRGAEVVLGIDAAWTATQPSGVALVRRDGARWRCIGAAPSYASFLDLARGVPVDWSAKPAAGMPRCDALLDAAERLAGAPPSVVAVDMPLSTQPIRSRRIADEEVSRAFGARGCAVHSPSADRPGPIADALRAALGRRGFPLACSDATPGTIPALLEVYPHTALLRLLEASYRVPYKAGKTAAFWPDADLSTRRHRLLDVWGKILAALSDRIAGIVLEVPPVGTMSHLKRYEDVLDAIICAWTGTEYLRGALTAHGDATGAIWT